MTLRGAWTTKQLCTYTPSAPSAPSPVATVTLNLIPEGRLEAKEAQVPCVVALAYRKFAGYKTLVIGPLDADDLRMLKDVCEETQAQASREGECT